MSTWAVLFVSLSLRPLLCKMERIAIARWGHSVQSISDFGWRVLWTKLCVGLVQSGVFLAVLHKRLDFLWSLRLFYFTSQSLSFLFWKMELLIEPISRGCSHEEMKRCLWSILGHTKCPHLLWFYAPRPISPIWGGLALTLCYGLGFFSKRTGPWSQPRTAG